MRRRCDWHLSCTFASAMWRLATALLGITACYEPSFRDCEVTCAADTDCAPGHACEGGLCVGDGNTCQVSVDAAIDAPVSAVGRYSMQIVNRENGCALGNWNEGSNTNVEVVIVENGALVVAEPQGLIATFLDLWLGAHVFAGSMTGDQLALLLAGNKLSRQGKCEYTFDATFAATLEGDFLRGELGYRARTNGHRDCAALVNCQSRQELTGARAPR